MTLGSSAFDELLLRGRLPSSSGANITPVDLAQAAIGPV